MGTAPALFAAPTPTAAAAGVKTCRRPPACLARPRDCPPPAGVSVPGNGSCQRPWKGETGLGEGLLETIHCQPGQHGPTGRHKQALSIDFYLVVRTKIDSLRFRKVFRISKLQDRDFGVILESFWAFLLRLLQRGGVLTVQMFVYPNPQAR